MRISFETLREEALAGNPFEPFVIDLGEEGEVSIEAVPTQLFTTAFDLGGNSQLTVEAALEFVRSIFTRADWKKLGPILNEQPLSVTVALVDKIVDHFNLEFNGGDTAGKSEDSEA